VKELLGNTRERDFWSSCMYSMDLSYLEGLQCIEDCVTLGVGQVEKCVCGGGGEDRGWSNL
jgi:hypothetical protein